MPWSPCPATTTAGGPAPEELDKHELLKEIIGNLIEATRNAIELIRAAITRFDKIAGIPSPAHSALELAIWSDRSRISPAVKEKLAPIAGKYF